MLAEINRNVIHRLLEWFNYHVCNSILFDQDTTSSADVKDKYTEYVFMLLLSDNLYRAM